MIAETTCRYYIGKVGEDWVTPEPGGDWYCEDTMLGTITFGNSPEECLNKMLEM